MSSSSGGTPIDNLTASAISTVIGGNTGVTPFLTLLLVGIIERSDPDILHMDERLENLLASDVGIMVLGLATGLEFVSMCVPIVDEMVDSVMTFAIPFISAIASMSTFGLFGSEADEILSTIAGAEPDERMLQQSGGGLVANPFQFLLICFGIVLALCLHFFKMIVRLFGEGWATGCLTILETMWTCMTIFVVVFIQPISILFAIFLCGVGLYAAYRVYKRIQKRRQDADGSANVNAGVQQQQQQHGAVEMGGGGQQLAGVKGQAAVPVAVAVAEPTAP